MFRKEGPSSTSTVPRTPSEFSSLGLSCMSRVDRWGWGGVPFGRALGDGRRKAGSSMGVAAWWFRCSEPVGDSRSEACRFRPEPGSGEGLGRLGRLSTAEKVGEHYALALGEDALGVRLAMLVSHAPTSKCPDVWLERASGGRRRFLSSPRGFHPVAHGSVLFGRCVVRRVG
jgi:hypothetical protein